MPDSVPTLGELNRNIVGLRAELAEHRRELTAVHDLRTRSELNREAIKRLDAELSEVQGTITWIARLVIGTLVLAALGLIMQAPAL